MLIALRISIQNTDLKQIQHVLNNNTLKLINIEYKKIFKQIILKVPS